MSKPPLIPELISILLFITIKARISVHQQEPGQSNSILSMIEKQIITDFTSNLIGISSLACFSLFSIKVNSITLEELNQFPGFVYLFMYQMICPSFVAFSVFFVNYFRCRALRETLHREFNDHIVVKFVHILN